MVFEIIFLHAFGCIALSFVTCDRLYFMTNV